MLHRRVVRQYETQAELVSGCEAGYKDVFDLFAADLRPAPAAAGISGHPASLMICVYRDDPALTGPVGSSMDGVGSFVAGGRVTGAEETALLAGLVPGGTTATCPRRHTDFAVVTPAVDQAGVAVELGACDRVLKTDYQLNGVTALQEDGIGQASPSAMAIIGRAATAAG